MNEENDTLLIDLCADPELTIAQGTVTKDPILDTKTTDGG
jgi:hypothetical protein